MDANTLTLPLMYAFTDLKMIKRIIRLFKREMNWKDCTSDAPKAFRSFAGNPNCETMRRDLC